MRKYACTLLTAFIGLGCGKENRSVTPVQLLPYRVQHYIFSDSVNYLRGMTPPFGGWDSSYAVQIRDSILIDTALQPQYYVFRQDTFRNPNDGGSGFIARPPVQFAPMAVVFLYIRGDTATVHVVRRMTTLQMGYYLTGVKQP